MDNVDLFFKYLTELNKVNKKINKDFIFTSEMIYNELMYFNIYKEDIRHLFNRWIDRFSSRPGIKVFKDNNFCLFVGGNVNKNNSFKMYISLSKNIDESVTKIFEYLRSNSINHISRVTSYTRYDTLTINVNTLDDVILIKKFLDNEKIVYKTMPFTIEGVVRDSLYAYAFEICKIISECFKKGIKLNSKVFSNYISQKVKYSKDDNLKLIYNVCYLSLLKTSCLEDLNDCVLAPKKSSKLLNECLKQTKDKYGINHTKKALLMYLNDNNINGFTRGKKYFSCRTLISRMDKDDILDIMVNEVGNYKTLKTLVQKYVNLKFANEVAQAKEKKIKKENVIFDCCAETYKKHGYNYALGALRAFKCGSLDLFDVSDRLKDDVNVLISKDEISSVLKDIIFESYPNIDEKDLKVLEKQGLIETTIMNLVKGYVDIQ